MVELGTWTINAKSGGNFKECEFVVTGEDKELDNIHR